MEPDIGQETGTGAGVVLAATVLDGPDPRVLAEFYRALTGWPYAPGHEQVDPAGDDWLILDNPDGTNLAFARVAGHRRPRWPDPGDEPSAQLHLDFLVPDLPGAVRRARDLGATSLPDPNGEPESIVVLADPAGHPFCLIAAG